MLLPWLIAGSSFAEDRLFRTCVLRRRWFFALPMWMVVTVRDDSLTAGNFGILDVDLRWCRFRPTQEQRGDHDHVQQRRS